MMHSVMFQGIDLREYSREIESKLNEVEQASISDCILLLARPL